MTIDMNNLPTNPDELIAIIAGFQNKYSTLEEEHHILSEEYNAYQNESKNKIETLTANHKLEILSRDEKIDQLLRSIFSSKSEKRIRNSFENSQQPSFFDAIDLISIFQEPRSAISQKKYALVYNQSNSDFECSTFEKDLILIDSILSTFLTIQSLKHQEESQYDYILVYP